MLKNLLRRMMGPRIASRIKSKIADLQFRKWSKSPDGRKNRERLSLLKGRHAGRRAFVIGNGPSLKLMNLRRLADEVSIGSNGIFLLQDNPGFTPNYHTIEDRLVGEDRRQETERYRGPVKIYPFDLQYCLGSVPEALWVNFDRRAQTEPPQFSSDACTRIFWGGTVTYMNLQLAWYLGCNPVYLIGVDHSYQDTFKIAKEGAVWTSQEDDHNHFDPRYFGKGYRWHDPNVARMELSYHAAQQFAVENNWKVFNATVGGKLEVFPRVDFEQIFETNDK